MLAWSVSLASGLAHCRCAALRLSSRIDDRRARKTSAMICPPASSELSCPSCSLLTGACILVRLGLSRVKTRMCLLGLLAVWPYVACSKHLQYC